MTVASTTNRESYIGNGTTTAFPFPNPYRASSDLVVTLRTIATGAESLQVEGVNYTVSGTPTSDAGGFASGTVTFTVAPTAAQQVHIDRVVTRTQATDYVAGDGIPPSSIEGSLDKLTQIVQELDSRFGRTLLQPRTAANRNLVLPEPRAADAGKVLGVNALGTSFELTAGGGVSDGDKGDITVSGPTWTIDNDAVTNAKLANVSSGTIKGRVTASLGDPEDLTGTQATTLLDVFTSSLKGLAPASGGGTTNFLRADGSWAAPAGGGGSQNVFESIAVSGQSTIVADSTTDTLTFAAGSNIAITTNATTDTITIATSGLAASATTDATNASNIGSGTLAVARLPQFTGGDVTTAAAGSVDLQIAANAVGTTEIANDAVTYAKIQNVSATDRILGRSTAGAGDIEEITCTAAGRALIDDADASAQRTTLGLTIGTNVQAYDADLAALAAISTNGVLARTGSGTAAARTITGTASEITVTNGDGVSGNPTLSLPTALTLTGKTVTGGTFSNLASVDAGGNGTTPFLGNFWQANSAGTDFATVQIRRIANHSGGTPGVTSKALSVRTDVTNAAATNFEWAGLFRLDNGANAGENTALYGQALKTTNTAGPTFAGVFEVKNATNSGDGAGKSLVGVEIDVFSNGADTNSNRIGIDVVAGKGDPGGSNCVVTTAFRATNATGSSYTNGIDMSLGVYDASALRLGKGNTQSINFGGDAIGTSPFMYGDTSNNAVIRLGSGAGFTVLDSTGASTRFAVGTNGELGIGNNVTPGTRLAVSTAALGTAANDTNRSVQLLTSVTGNNSALDTVTRRHAAGSDWTGTNIRVQRDVDGTKMGFIDFGINGSSANQGLGFGSNTTTHFTIASDGTNVNVTSASGEFRVNGTKVVTSRRTGWAAATGTATRTTFDTTTVTTAQLAERVKALIDDLTTHGLIGT